MDPVIIALSANVGAFLGTFIAITYKQGKIEGELKHINTRLERVEDVLNHKED